MHSQHLAEYKNVYDAAVSCLSLYPNQYSVISIGLRGDISYETMRLDIEKWAQLYSKPDKNPFVSIVGNQRDLFFIIRIREDKGGGS